ncbi:nucleotidyltransferase [Mycoplasma sp. 005V]|uniref:nucleotidyltransferase n=1 Tax=unclassified Mycoplasma TaxID=2683645 RepID=UPI003A85C995
MKKNKKKNRVGIVVEYNPFHNGHIYQINWIKKNIPNPYIIVAMSNKFTQRGEIACASFRERKKIAKAYGVDKVVKLADQDVIQAAHIFAQAGVKLLNKHKIDYLVFGSESNNVELLINIAKTIKEKNQEYNQLVKQYLKKGANSFPRANNLALQTLMNQNIEMPNDILGLEYIKTIVNNDLPIQPISIERTIQYHAAETKQNFASASKIREMLKNGQDVSMYTPMKLSYNPKNDIAKTYPKFKKIILTKTPKQLAQYKLIDEGIENLFKKQVLANDNYADFIESCVSKRYTRSRIQRSYLNILLKIKKAKA